MPKNIPANLLSDIRATVSTLVHCVYIRRKNGGVLRLTAHETDLTIGGDRYRADIPFSLSAIRSGSQMNVDNADITLFPDNVNVFLADFDNGLYDYADCEIFEVDYKNPDHGIMTMRKGQFGAYEFTRTGIAKMTVTGLMKILDYTVGRVYQPSCDADLGDRRCKVAISQAQGYSQLEDYHLGEWVYKYDLDAMTALPVVNPSFEADGFVGINGTITGWTKIPGSKLEVRDASSDLTNSIGSFTARDGTYWLSGWENTEADGHVSGVYQDIDLVAGGITLSDIEDGKISIAFRGAFLQGFYLLDPARLKVDIMDASGDIVDSYDTNFERLTKVDVWRERWFVFPLVSTGRTLRIWCYLQKNDGVMLNTAVDDIRLWWYDHTLGTPYHDVVHKVTRIYSRDDGNVTNPANPSFELQGNVGNALSPTITGWVTTGHWWQVGTTIGGLGSQDGDRHLHGGDDGGTTQRTYEATQTVEFTGSNTPNIDVARVTSGKIAGRIAALVGFGDTISAAGVRLDFLDGSNTLVATADALALQTSPDLGWADLVYDFAVPTSCRKVKIVLRAQSPVGDGFANVGFDKVQMWFFDAERSLRADPIAARGSVDTPWAYDVGSFTFDGSLVWRAVGAFVHVDEVASVTTRKVFRGTEIAGSEGIYEGAAIRWISGANAGLKNLVRTWDPATKELKLYFKSPFAIQAGDRFQYVRNCQRRFTEDCISVFGNQINFRGFPHLPGKLTNE
jgi:hypothetical protein